MWGFGRARDVVEKDAVYVGGWSLQHLLVPKRKGGIHGEHISPLPSPELVTDNKGGDSDSSEDRVNRVAVQQDWTAAEERALVRKLDLRVLLPCCIVYFFAYLGIIEPPPSFSLTPASGGTSSLMDLQARPRPDRQRTGFASRDLAQHPPGVAPSGKGL